VTAPRVLLLEVSGPESGAITRAAAASGYQVHAATDPATHAAYGADLTGLLTGCLLTNFARPDHALHDVVTYARRHGIGAVLTTNEYLTELLARVCDALGLPGNDPEHAHTARNKAAMAEAFSRHGVAAPHTCVVGDEDELRALDAAGGIAFPCVIKPAEGAGSAGVTVVTDPTDVTSAWRSAHAPRGMYGMPLDARVLVQDYADGTEYSVESFTQDGLTTHLCVTDKAVTKGPHRVETGHSLPARLPSTIRLALYRAVEKAIAAVGICNSASHTEVVVDPYGHCTVIEIGARLGAGQIGFLIQHALGVDPWAALLDTALGRPARLTPTRHEYATVRFLTSPRAGRLVSVSGLPRVGPDVPLVRLRTAAGTAVHGAGANSHRLGSFVVTGPDATAVEERADALLRKVGIKIAPHPAQARPAAGQVRSASTALIAE
jgi:biotin carboxylase